MTFKDPKMGGVFVNIGTAIKAWCNQREACCNCPLCFIGSYDACWEWTLKFTAEAARLMGYEVVEESCDTCAYNPPSSGDGKPCSMCETSDPMLNCYQKKEGDRENQSSNPCKWCQDEFCTNADSPMRADYCPVPDTPFVCLHEDRRQPGGPFEILDSLVDNFFSELDNAILTQKNALKQALKMHWRNKNDR